MQYSDYNNPVFHYPEVNDVPLHRPAPVTLPDMVTTRGSTGRLGQNIKGFGQEVDVADSLTPSPLADREFPDRLKVRLRCWG